MKRIFTAVALLVTFIAACTLCRSCANTTTPPSGGPKDTIPPVLLKLTPENNTTNFPVEGTRILLLFNEYTVVKEASGVIVSPPLKKRPSIKVKGKNIVVTFQDSLKSDQTYTIDFGDALADNNEGNLAPRLVYSFSTGETIDSMYVTGNIIDSKTLEPIKKATVALYSDLSDSACFLKVPDAVTMSDEWGFFVVRNIKPLKYRIYAYSDLDNNYKYDPDGDNVAFLDSLYTPHNVVSDSVYELGHFKMKDTLRCRSRKAMMTLSMFKELQSVQYLQNSGRKTEKSGFFKFSAADVQINSLEFTGIDSSKVIIQYSPQRDSLDFWINVNYRLEDSLLVKLNYMKTDSTGQLAPYTENLSMAIMRESATTQKEKAEKTETVKKPAKDTVFEIKQSVSNETVEQEGFFITSDLPITKIVMDSIRFTETNPKGQKTSKSFSFWQDTFEIRKYHIKPNNTLIKGYEYSVMFPQGTFINLNKLPNKELRVDFKVPSGEDLCTLSLNLSNVDSNYILDFLDENGHNILRSYTVNTSRTIEIPYLKPGKYLIRLTHDANGNGFADTGNLLGKKQPEKVRFFKVKHDTNIFEIPEAFDIEQDIDIKTIFE